MAGKVHKRIHRQIRRKEIPRGIDGWLLVITIIFIISGVIALVNLISTLSILIEKLPRLAQSNINITNFVIFLISFVFLALVLVFIIRSVYLIISRKKSAIKFSIITLWIAFAFDAWAIIIGCLVLSVNLITNKSDSIKFPCMMSLMLASLLITIIWTFYFLKSKRVKHTLIK